jgi:hypothetical protein
MFGVSPKWHALNDIRIFPVCCVSLPGVVDVPFSSSCN